MSRDTTSTLACTPQSMEVRHAPILTSISWQPLSWLLPLVMAEGKVEEEESEVAVARLPTNRHRSEQKSQMVSKI